MQQPEFIGLTEQVIRQEEANRLAQKNDNQAVINRMSLTINNDYKAVGMAIRDLLKEGWIFESIQKNIDKYQIILSRRWEC